MGDLTEEITRDCQGIPLYIGVSRSTFSMVVHPRRPAIAPVVLWQAGLSPVGHSFVCAPVIQLHKKGEHLGR
jgi:hypothetical protein